MRKPLFIRRVAGHSMEPTLRDGQLVVATGWLKPHTNALVIAWTGGLEVIKRAAIKAGGEVELSGDKHGRYDVVPRDMIMGRVIGVFSWR